LQHDRSPLRSRDPDGWAWGQIHDLALRVALSRLRDRGAAEEVAQEAALRLWRFRDGLESAASAEAWVVRVSANEASRLHERRGRLHAREVLDDGDRGAAASEPETTDAVHLRVAIMAELNRLPVQDRKILALHYFGDVPLPIIAQRMGMPLGTVKARLSRARRRLSNYLTA
jgi:RNA polymerase sigma-70 factor, ECF subfamily